MSLRGGPSTDRNGFLPPRVHYRARDAAADAGRGVDELREEQRALAIEYIFPPHMPVVHKALVRLAVYAKYGPGIREDDAAATTRSDASPPPPLRLRGGLRLLQRHEEQQLLAEEERAIIAEIYNTRNCMDSTSVTIPEGTARNVNILPRTAAGLKASLRNQGPVIANATADTLRTSLATTLAYRKRGLLGSTATFSATAAASAPASPAAASLTAAAAPSPLPRARPRCTSSLVAPNTTAMALPDPQFGELARTKHPLYASLLEMTRSELHAVLDTVEWPAAAVAVAAATSPAKDGSGAAPATAAKEPAVRRSCLFDALSDALLAERERRIAALKATVPSEDLIRRDADVTKRLATHYYNRTTPKVRAIRSYDNPKDVLAALHRYAYQVIDPSRANTGNAAEVNYNVRCLRADYVADRARDGWDGQCCVRGTAPSKITTLRTSV